MKKLFSLLMLAMLTLSAVAATTVTLDFTSNDEWDLPTSGGATSQTYTNADGYSITLNGTNARYGDGYLLLGKSGATLTFPAFDKKVSQIVITGRSGASASVKQNIYVGDTAVSTETTGATGVNTYAIAADYQTAGTIYVLKVTSSHNTQITKIDITLMDDDNEVAAPVFTPNGGVIYESTEVTLTSTSEPCDIFYKEGEEDGSYTGYTHYSGPFYVNETKTFSAYAAKSGNISEVTTVTFTRELPTVAKPTFETGNTTFDDEQIVTINCATEGATIMYSINDGEYQTYNGAFSVTETSTIKAYATLEGYNDSDVATVTYTKIEAAAAATYQLVSDVATLQDGDKIALVGVKDAAAYVMADKQNNNFKAEEITIADGEFTSNKPTVITLEKNDTVWNMKVAGIDVNGTAYDGYLYAASSTSNHLKVQATVDGNANAQITNGENGAMSIVFKGTNTRNVVQYNSNSSLFSCYATASQLPVYIYKQTATGVEAPAAPTITPESQEYTEDLEVTITNNAADATLWYALNDGEYNEYNGAITLHEATTTVKAYAEKDGVKSDVVSATYTYVPATVNVENLAAAKALDNNATFTFTGNDVVVTYKYNKNLWVRDASGSALIYGTTDSTIVQGVVVAPNWGGTKATYLDQPELTNVTNFAASGTTQVVAPLERETLTMDNYAEYVIIKNVTIDSTYTSGDKVNYVTSAGVLARNNFFIDFSPVEGQIYNLIGVVSAYNGAPQLYLTAVEGYVAEVPEVNTIAEAAGLGVGKTFSYISEATVVYQNAGRLWIKDNSGYGLIFGSTNEGNNPVFEQGTVLSDNWTAKVTGYYDTKQFTGANGLADGGDRVTVTPEEVETFSLDNMHHYVTLKNQTLTSSADKTWINADSLIFYNQFGLDLTFDADKKYDVEGMVGAYKNTVELFIISVTEVAEESWQMGDVNHDNKVDVADVSMAINRVLGKENTQTFYEAQGDINHDNKIDVSDVSSIINIALGK